ncbi:MAG: hypothetical protein ACPGR5_00545 [Chitinophagales bacterium]
MKKITFTLMLFSMFFTNCSKENYSVCESNLCLEYETIWKKLFKEKNNMSEKYFTEHVNILSTNITQWNSGENFNIVYNISIDWANIKVTDQFLIKKSAEENIFSDLNLPDNKYLNEEEIKRTINLLAFSSKLTIVKPINNLKFDSKASAKSYLKKNLEFRNPKFNEPFYKSIKWTFIPNGNPFISGGGIINNSNNECYKFEMDLVTGKIKQYTTACSTTQ